MKNKKLHLKLIFLLILIIFPISCKKNPTPYEVIQFNIDVHDNNVDEVKKTLKKNPMLKFWTMDTSKFGPIFYAVETNNYEMVKLIADKKNVNTIATFDEIKTTFSPLYDAIEKSVSPEIIQLLLDLGADVKFSTLNSQTSIVHHFAAENRSVETWNILEPYITESMMNQKDKLGFTPIEDLMRGQYNNLEFGSEDACYLLQSFIDKGSKLEDAVNSKDNLFANVSVILLCNKFNDYLRLLLQNIKVYPLIITEDNTKYDLLQMAVFNKDWEMIFEIIPHISDYNSQCTNNYTSLHIAALVDAPDYIFEMLLSAGCKKEMKDADGLTAYDLYKQYSKVQDEKIINLLKL